MSISFPRKFKNTFTITSDNKSPKDKNLTLLNYFPYYTKPSNLKNLNNNETTNSSKTYFTTSKKPKIQNYFKVITPSLNNNNKINKKSEEKDEEKNNIVKNNVLLSSEESSSGLEEVSQEENKNLSEKEQKEKLLLFFKGKKIYVEIFNGKENASSTFLEILLEYQIIQCKRLCKNIDYIIFKEGHLKTKKYAVMNNIKMVNPLWVDDKINRNIFKDDKEYFVETNMGDILLQEKLGKNNTTEKNYENELEAEFDEEYANMIDKQRENNNKNKEEKNSTNQKIMGREKRKSKMPKSKTEIIFLSDNEPQQSKNMVIEDFLETNNSSNNFANNANNFNNENKIEPNNEPIKEEKKDDTNNSKNINIAKKTNPFIIQKISKKDRLNNRNNNNNNINLINDNIKSKNAQKTRSKTPDKIKSKSIKRNKTKSKDYKHKATSKKIMVTNVKEMFENNTLMILDNNISQNNSHNNNSQLNKENQNINSNFTPNNNIISKKPEFITKDKDNPDKTITPKKSTLGQKINIITYRLEEKEMQCLKTMHKFEYKGDLKNSLSDYGAIYSSASVIVLDKEKSKYDWKMYEFFFDKKILVDFASFLFEFTTEKTSEDIIDAKNTLDTLNKISINEETYFFNKKIRYKRRSLLHSYNIVENISDHKKEKDEKNNENKKMINFVINKNIVGGEKRVIHKILKVYLKANVIKIDLPAKRSHSVGPGMKFRFKTEHLFSNGKKGNIFLIQKMYENKNKMDIIEEKGNDINENKLEEEDDDEITNEDKNETNEVKGDTYLISKEKVVNNGIIRHIPNFKEVISYKYVFDSFLAGELKNLNDDNILKKYQFI